MDLPEIVKVQRAARGVSPCQQRVVSYVGVSYVGMVAY